MALHRGKEHDRPSGSVFLTAEQALEYQEKVIYGWEPKRDVWPFHYGCAVLGVSSGFTGMYINNHYRRKLRLFNYGKMSTYLPIIVLPTLASTFLHKQLVTADIIIQKTKCPVCLEVRAGALQTATSTLYPIGLAPLASFMMATRYFTYKIPPFTEKPKEVFKLWLKMTKPIKNTLFTIAVGQALLAMVITYLEADSYFKVQEELNRLSDLQEEK